MIIEKMNNLKNEFDDGICHECYEYWIYYFNSSLIDTYVKFFDNIHHVIIKSSNNLELFSIILTYLIALDFQALKSFKMILEKILILIKINFYLLVKQILNKKIIDENNYSYLLYIKKLNQTIDKYLKNDLNET